MSGTQRQLGKRTAAAARAADSPTRGAGGVPRPNLWGLANKDRCDHLVLMAA